jgi:hypothetical protein
MRRLNRTQRARRARARRLCRQIETILRAAVGDDVGGNRRRIDRDRRDVVARLLGYPPEKVVGLFVVVDPQ